MTGHVPEDAVVVGVDGSPEGWHALRWAADRAAETERPLHIIHAEGTLFSSHSPAEVEPIDNVCTEALGIVDHRPRRPAVTWSQPTDSPVAALVHASVHAAEIVLGTKGTGSVRGAVLGSVTTRVSGAAHCPVLIIRAAVTERQSRSPIVVGVDLRPDGDAALDFAFAEADRSGLPLEAVLCWQLDRLDFASGIPMPGGNMKAAHHHHHAQLDEALARPSSRHPGVQVIARDECAPTTDALVEHSATASLLVVGTRGHRELAGLVLGSVSQRVLRRALCPVAVVAHAAAAVHVESHAGAAGFVAAHDPAAPA
ncbi:MAG TPA: universal stress protein [Flexivirga sp.]|uniref:universal stress protein n=1 Tax=Flexivirga sp. TaxID=1962927 RepID=UPI002C5EDF8A|nr:universal stress protein [Flexivirga sp.]HWC22187.1 universal stress protein [Flexivirga sp.]